jgi:acyl phosphate:glycerol-3-phosphate acyltransferase
MRFVWIFAAYFIGSIPSGYLVFRLGGSRDIRQFGSRSTGATNVLRLKGWRYALPVLVIDLVKAALPVLLALRAFPAERWVALGVSLMVVLGHCFPVFIGFRGGKGVSTAMGSYAVLAPVPFLLSLAVFAGVIAATRFVSLGSLLAALAFPLIVFLGRGDSGLAALGLVVFVLISLRHAGNIRRLLKGQERKLGQRAKMEDR